MFCCAWDVWCVESFAARFEHVNLCVRVCVEKNSIERRRELQKTRVSEKKVKGGE